jgi:hypothetical protein
MSLTISNPKFIDLFSCCGGLSRFARKGSIVLTFKAYEKIAIATISDMELAHILRNKRAPKHLDDA